MPNTTPNTTPKTPDFDGIVNDYIEGCWQDITEYATELAETIGEEIVNDGHIRDAVIDNITLAIYEAHRLEPAGGTPTEIWPETYYEPLEQAVAKHIDNDLDSILAEALQNLKDNSEEAWERYCEYNEMTLPKN